MHVCLENLASIMKEFLFEAKILCLDFGEAIKKVASTGFASKNLPRIADLPRKPCLDWLICLDKLASISCLPRNTCLEWVVCLENLASNIYLPRITCLEKKVFANLPRITCLEKKGFGNLPRINCLDRICLEKLASIHLKKSQKIVMKWSKKSPFFEENLPRTTCLEARKSRQIYKTRQVFRGKFTKN